MLEAINIVRGSISANDLVPVLKHLVVHERRICAFDGRVYISAPCDILYGDHSFTVPSAPFISAIERVDERRWEMTHDLTARSLRITSANYSATMPTGPVEAFPLFEDDRSKRKKWRGALLPSLALLQKFVGLDASRPWNTGVLLMGARALATNNVVLAEVTLPGIAPAGVVLPLCAIVELLRIDREPTHYVQTEQTLTLYFEGDVWLRTRLVAEPWPETALTLLHERHSRAQMTPVSSALSDAISALKPLCADARAPKILFRGDTVQTEDGNMTGKMSGFNDLGHCSFRIEPILEVLALATSADWSMFPVVPWAGQDISGVIMGLVQ